MKTPQAQLIDRTPRYAPERVIIASRMALLPVLSYIAHPAGAHPEKCPIKSDMIALECKTEAGSRWFGCERAYINSELRMVTVGFDSRDEVRSKWPVAEIA
jgi:hypothetical protein